MSWGVYHEDSDFYPEGVLAIVHGSENDIQDKPGLTQFQTALGNGTRRAPLERISFASPRKKGRVGMR